ncbi:hypothetical protein [Rhodococcus opacus]|uniref:hypothetical protein n=1 Tax=Rhodococcus opacus TaxID=37919 RepID=UPI0024767BE0|nr:hypothetical protein [Rhodococcus opacus]
MRADESAARRHLNARGGIHHPPRRDDCVTTDVEAHIARHRLPVNPVYATLRDLGVPARQHRFSHFIDGSHLDRGRLPWLRRGPPTLFE